jgi:hypothetical protein
MLREGVTRMLRHTYSSATWNPVTLTPSFSTVIILSKIVQHVRTKDLS